MQHTSNMLLDAIKHFPRHPSLLTAHSAVNKCKTAANACWFVCLGNIRKLWGCWGCWLFYCTACGQHHDDCWMLIFAVVKPSSIFSHCLYPYCGEWMFVSYNERCAGIAGHRLHFLQLLTSSSVLLSCVMLLESDVICTNMNSENVLNTLKHSPERPGTNSNITHICSWNISPCL